MDKHHKDEKSSSFSDYIRQEINLLEEEIKASSSNSGFGFQRVQILIADDHHQNVTLLRNVLNKHFPNLNVIDSTDGHKILDILEKNEVKILIINADLFYKEKNMHLINYINTKANLKNQPKITIASEGHAKDQNSMLLNQTNSMVVSTPFSISQLVRTLKSLLPS